MKIDLNFSREYELETAVDLPSGPAYKVWYYPGASTLGGRDGILLKVIPREADPWYGLFARADAAFVDSDGIFSCPNRQHLCVISGGVAYLVNVYAPLDWREISCRPVRDVIPFFEHDVILFIDYTRIACLGISGQQWETDDVSSDGVTISQIRDDTIFGTGAMHYSSGPIVEFAVDLRTGMLKQAPLDI